MWPPGSATALGSGRRTHIDAKRNRQRGGGLELADELVERGAAGRFAGAGAAGESRPEMLGVERAARICLSTASPSLCSTASGTNGTMRLASTGTPKIAVTMSEAPAARLNATTLRRKPAFGRAAAIERVGAILDRGSERRIADFQPRQQRLAAAAEPQHAIGRRHPPQFGIRPFVEHAMSQRDDPQRRRAGFDHDVVARAAGAVEIAPRGRPSWSV